MTREDAIARLKNMAWLYGSTEREQNIEAIDMAIEALSEPSKVDYRTDKSANIGTEVNDLISRADAIEAVAEEWLSEASAESPYVNNDDIGAYKKLAEELFADIPSANYITEKPNDAIKPSNDVISRADAIEEISKGVWNVYELIDRINTLPSADRPKGEWEDREVFNDTDDDHIVEEWQSARCSVCGKYHTTPYMYYFNNYNYCPNCGAYMGGKE